MLVTLLDVPLDWRDQAEYWLVILAMAGVVYLALGYLSRSLNPTGALSRQGKRWRKGVPLLVLLSLATFEVASLVRGSKLDAAVGVAVCGLLGFLFLLLVRWWWRDRHKEKAAYQALVEKANQGGRELAAPQMSAGKKTWRWVVNGYAIFLIAAGLYALVHYLLTKL
jgi:hypothetical protein